MAPTFLRDKRAQTNHNGGAGNRKLVVCLVDDEISNEAILNIKNAFIHYPVRAAMVTGNVRNTKSASYVLN